MGLIARVARAGNLAAVPAALALCAATASAQVSLQAAPKNPPATWENKSGQIVIMTSTRVRVSGTEDAIITSFTVSASGTLDDQADIASLNLCLDLNENGCWDPGTDVEIVANKTFAADNGSYTFTFSRVIQQGTHEDWMVVVHLGGTASQNETAQFTVGATAASAIGVTSSNALTVSGTLTTGGVKTICGLNGTLELSDYPVVQPAGCPEGTTDFPIAGLHLKASTGAKIDVSAITWTASGTGRDVQDLVQVKLWLDANGNGTVDTGDAPIGGGTVQFNTDDGTAVFSGLSEQIAAGGCERWLLTYDFAATLVKDTTFTASVTGTPSLGVATNPSGGTMQVHGTPTAHATYTAPCGGGSHPGGGPGTGPASNPYPEAPRRHVPSYCCAVAPGIGIGGGGAGGLGRALEQLLLAWAPLLMLAGLLLVLRRRATAVPATRRIR